MKNIKLFFKSMVAMLAIILLLFGGNTYATKHVLYMDNVVNTTQHFCISVPLPSDTFVVYTPSAFVGGGTWWKVNGSGNTYNQDSIVYIPGSVSNFYIKAISYAFGFEQMFLLKLYSTPPAHAQFEVLSGGSINATNDTIRMCEASMNVSASGSINGDTYMIWTGPSFFSSTAPVTLSTPGTYVFERGNPCGVTRDTFQLVALPFTVPVFTSDTVFCNTPVSLTLDPGPGWNSSWTPGGATTQTLFVDTAGTYTVNLTNVCTSGLATINVEYQLYPVPDLWQYQTLPRCYGDTVTLDPSPGWTYTSYYWSTGATIPTITVTGPSAFYQVTVTQGTCSASVYTQIDFYNIPTTAEICIVTVDASLNKNMIVWTADNEPFPGDPQYASLSGYNIYKAVGFNSWSLIGNVAANLDHSFVDASSNPPSVSALYKITMVDTCGTEGLKSWYHKTILLSVTMGANPGEIPLLWNEYKDESGNFVVDKYILYRGDSPTSMILYDSVPGYNTSYVDTGVYTQKYYQIVVTKFGGCDPAPAFLKGGTKTLVTGSSSNITNNVVTGIAAYNSAIFVSIYPNPSSTGIFQIEGDKISRVEVTDMLGNILFTTKKTIDLSAYAKGMYNVRIISTMGSTSYKKIVVQ